MVKRTMGLIHLLLIFFFTNTTSCVETGITSVFAMENRHQTNKIFDQNIIGKTKAESVGRCAFRCLQNVACMAYFYHENTTQCHLAKLSIPGENGLWRSDSGWQYYHAYESKYLLIKKEYIFKRLVDNRNIYISLF